MTIDVKGLVREYLLIIFLYSLDLGTEFAVYTENIKARTRYEKWLKDDYKYQLNRTTNFGICKSANWDKKDYEKKVGLYGGLLDTYLFFLVISGAIFLCYLLAYLWFVLRSWHRAIYIEENRDHVVRVKFAFGFILSFALDIPGSCLAVILYSLRQGERGLHCWDCAQDVEKCVNKHELEENIYFSRIVVVLMLFSLVIVSIWKGITTFYRWSKTDKVDCWQIRGCVALFVGVFYVVIVMTPSLGVFKYEFFMLPSQKANVFAQFTDSLFMIGMLGWIIFLVIGCCFPIIKCIRIGSSPIMSNKKTNV